MLKNDQLSSISNSISRIDGSTIEGNSSQQPFLARGSTSTRTTTRTTTTSTLQQQQQQHCVTTLTEAAARIIIHPPNKYGTCIELLNKRGVENHPSVKARNFLPQRSSTDARLNNWSRVKLYYKYIELKVKDSPGLSEEDAAKAIDKEREEKCMNMYKFCEVLRAIPELGCETRAKKRPRVE